MTLYSICSIYGNISFTLFSVSIVIRGCGFLLCSDNNFSEHKESTIYKIMGQDHCGPGFWQDEVIDLIDDFFEKHMKRI